LNRGDNMPDYFIHNGELYHHGVKGMKWGVRKKIATTLAPKTHTTTYSRKKELKKQYAKDKGARRGLVNAANSAARTYYRMDRTKDFQTYRKQQKKLDLKMARLPEEQVKNGRYRVARARNIKRKTLSVALAGGAGAALTAAGAAAIGIPLAVVGTVGLNYATGGRYYAKQKRAYGGTRAKYQAKDERKKNRT
jgi:hypothetical protein